MENFHRLIQTKFILLRIIAKMEENHKFKLQLIWLKINGLVTMKKINSKIKSNSHLMIIMIKAINNKDKKVL